MVVVMFVPVTVRMFVVVVMITVRVLMFVIMCMAMFMIMPVTGIVREVDVKFYAG